MKYLHYFRFYSLVFVVLFISLFTGTNKVYADPNLTVFPVAYPTDVAGTITLNAGGGYSCYDPSGNFVNNYDFTHTYNPFSGICGNTAGAAHLVWNSGTSGYCGATLAICLASGLTLGENICIDIGGEQYTYCPLPPSPTIGTTTSSTIDQGEQNLFNAFVLYFISMFGVIWLLRKK